MINIRYQIGRLLQRTPYRVMREDRVPQCTANLFALGARLVLARQAEGQCAVVVQVGAFDGLFADGLEPIIERPGGFTALLVEPQPGAFKKIEALYGSRKDVLLENAAITELDGDVDLFSDDAGATPFATLLPSRAVHVKSVAGSLQVVKVRGLTVESLLARHRLSRVDMLMIDTEGFDLVILRQFLNCLGAPPLVIQLESHHLSRPDRAELRSLLIQHGYGYVDTLQDTVCFHARLSACSPQL